MRPVREPGEHLARLTTMNEVTDEQAARFAVRSAEYLAFEAMKVHFRTADHMIGTEFWVTGRGTVELRVQCGCGWEWES